MGTHRSEKWAVVGEMEAGYWTHRRTLWHWQEGLAGRLLRVEWAGAPGARPAKTAAVSGRVEMFPEDKNVKNIFLVGFAFFPFHPRSQDSFHFNFCEK